jgi:hypothetical protein
VLRLALVVPDLAADYPARVSGLFRDLALPPHRPAAGRLSGVLGPTYILLGVTLASVTMVVRAIRALRPPLTTTTPPGGADDTQVAAWCSRTLVR